MQPHKKNKWDVDFEGTMERADVMPTCFSLSDNAIAQLFEGLPNSSNFTVYDTSSDFFVRSLEYQCTALAAAPLALAPAAPSALAPAAPSAPSAPISLHPNTFAHTYDVHGLGESDDCALDDCALDALDELALDERTLNELALDYCHFIGDLSLPKKQKQMKDSLQFTFNGDDLESIRLFGDDDGLQFEPFRKPVVRKPFVKKKNTKFAVLPDSGPGFKRYGHVIDIYDMQKFSVYYGNPCIPSIKRNANAQHYKVSTNGENNCTLTHESSRTVKRKRA